MSPFKRIRIFLFFYYKALLSNMSSLLKKDINKTVNNISYLNPGTKNILYFEFQSHKKSIVEKSSYKQIK